jgi:hypothetical protein
MKNLLTTITLFLTVGLYSQCDSLQTELDIEKVNNKITVDFLSEKMYESDVQVDKLKCQLETAKVEIMKQKTMKWIAIIGGGYISSMTFLMYIRK